MTATVPRLSGRSSSEETFEHDALFYAGPDEFVDHMTPFIREGLEEREPVLVVVIGPRVEALRSALGTEADEVLWADMAEVGRNPGRIISLWREFVAGRAIDGQRVRGIGEPIWASRTSEELVESQRHESLINLAFAGAPARIMCPYDTVSLDAPVIEEAYRSHPTVLMDSGARITSARYRGLDAIDVPFDDPLPEPAGKPEQLVLDGGGLADARDFVASRAVAFGLDDARVSDLVLAVNEATSNSLRHAGGRGTLRIWRDGNVVVCEIRDHGHIDEPLVGRFRPEAAEEGGFGLWLVNQLCDLVQVRSFASGSVVRLHIARA